jgi:hypothetical protein
MAEGRSTTEIAASLVITDSAVCKHIDPDPLAVIAAKSCRPCQ